jgi:heptosyltransferase-2
MTEKILIIKLASLGDVLRTTCILQGLHVKYTNAHITWLTSSQALPLLLNNRLINTVVSSNNRLFEKYDLVINLDDDPWACDLATSITTKSLIGAYSGDGTRYYTDSSAKWFDMSLISRYGKHYADRLKKQNLATYPDILFEILNIQSGFPSLVLQHQERNFAREFEENYLRKGRPIIGLNTGAGSRWRFKSLSEETTATLISLLIHSLDATVILFGGPGEVTRNNSIQQLSNNQAIDAGSKNSLLEFSALINLCDLLITSDSLALHIASCFKKPVIVFFGPTSASEIQLFGPGIKIVPDMECICCYKPDCDFERTCMDSISAQSLVNATKTLLPAPL